MTTQPPNKPINSRAKGARVERAAAKYLESLGFHCARMGRNGYSADDLKTEDPILDRFAIEVKGDSRVDVGTVALRNAWKQAEANAHATAYLSLGPSGMSLESGRSARIPVVLWKHNNRPWRLTWLEPFGLVTTSGDTEIKQAILRLAEGGNNGKDQRKE